MLVGDLQGDAAWAKPMSTSCRTSVCAETFHAQLFFVDGNSESHDRFARC
jgi:hypothetical protein